MNNDLSKVNDINIENIGNEVPMISELSQHILASGGKRIRPIITLLTSRLCNYKGENHLSLAACIEFIHTATLLHDDVIDESKLRRGVATANDLFGNKTSVLVGDFLFSRSFELMVANGSKKILEVLSATSSTIAKGEVLQLSTINNCSTSEETYMNIIRSKTASLFAAAAEISGILSEKDKNIQNALSTYGQKLGIAFQAIDDILGIWGDSEVTGKSAGNDLRERKKSMPVAFTLSSNTSEAEELKDIYSNQTDLNETEIKRAMVLIEKSGGKERTQEEARIQLNGALEALEGAKFKDKPLEELQEITVCVQERDH